MHGPVLVNWLLAVLTAASGTYCLSRLRRPSPACAPGPRAAVNPGAATGGDRKGGHPRLHGHDHGHGHGHGHGRESDAAEALMGLGMAAMAVTGPAVPPVVWAWLFGLPGAGFLVAALAVPGGRSPRLRAHRLHHAVGALAMAYMALAMAAAPATGHAQHGGVAAPGAGPGAGSPLLTGALLLYFGGYTLWAGSRLLSTPAGGLPRGAAAGLPRACRLAMGMGMFAMLLTL